MLTQEIETVLSQRPDLTLIKLADGARDNWTYLSAALPPGVELIDFYHVREHLKKAFYAAYGENSSRSKAQFEKYRYLLRDEPTGVEKIIRALAHFRDIHPRTKKLASSVCLASSEAPSIGRVPQAQDRLFFGCSRSGSGGRSRS